MFQFPVLLSSINDVAVCDRDPGNVLKPGQVLEKICVKGTGRFDFDGHKLTAKVQDQVNFVLIVIPPIIDGRAFSLIEVGLADFVDDKIFKSLEIFPIIALLKR